MTTSRIATELNFKYSELPIPTLTLDIDYFERIAKLGFVHQLRVALASFANSNVETIATIYLHQTLRSGHPLPIDTAYIGVVGRNSTELNSHLIQEFTVLKSSGSGTSSNRSIEPSRSGNARLEYSTDYMRFHPSKQFGHIEDGELWITYDDINWYSFDILTFLLDLGANPNALDAKRRSPMLDAYGLINHDGTGLVYVRSGVNPERLRDKSGRTPLIEASKNKDVEVVRQVIRWSQIEIDEYDENGVTPLIAAAENENSAVLKELLKYQPKLDKQDSEGNTALLVACLNENSEAALSLLRAGANVNISNNRDETPLIIAAESDDLSILEAIVSQKSDIDVFGESSIDALLRAFEVGNHGAISMILDTNVLRFSEFEDSEYSVLLCHAAACDNPAAVRTLINKGLDVEYRNKDGFTPLVNAATYGMVENVEVLLQAGANPDAVTLKGRTALMEAALNDQCEVVSILVSYVENIDAQDDDGRSALMDAATTGNQEILLTLMMAGADFSLQDTCGTTALHEYIRSEPEESYEGNLWQE